MQTTEDTEVTEIISVKMKSDVSNQWMRVYGMSFSGLSN